MSSTIKHYKMREKSSLLNDPAVLRVSVTVLSLPVIAIGLYPTMTIVYGKSTNWNKP